MKHVFVRTDTSSDCGYLCMICEWEVTDKQLTKNALVLEDLMATKCLSMQQTTYGCAQHGWVSTQSYCPHCTGAAYQPQGQYQGNYPQNQGLQGYPQYQPQSIQGLGIGGSLSGAIPSPVSKPEPKVIKCECGSESVGSSAHSEWCPKYE